MQRASRARYRIVERSMGHGSLMSASPPKPNVCALIHCEPLWEGVECLLQQLDSRLYTREYRATGRDSPDKRMEFSWQKPGILLDCHPWYGRAVVYWHHFGTLLYRHEAEGSQHALYLRRVCTRHAASYAAAGRSEHPGATQSVPGPHLPVGASRPCGLEARAVRSRLAGAVH